MADSLKVYPALGGFNVKRGDDTRGPSVASFDSLDAAGLFADFANMVWAARSAGYEVAGMAEAPAYPSGKVLAPWGGDVPLTAPFYYRACGSSPWGVASTSAAEAWARAYHHAQQQGLI